MRRLALCVVVLALLGGCGGSDPEDERGTSSEFVRGLDAVCRDTNPKLAEVMAALTRARDAARAGRVALPQTFEAFATLLRRATAITERFRARLRAIEVPRRERGFHRALTGSLGEGLSNLRQQTSAAEARDARRLRELSIGGSVISARGRGLFAGHGGFRSCGRR